MVFDFWNRAQVRLEDIGEGVGWGLALSLFRGFSNEFGSHIQAALSGWNYPASYADVITALHYRDFLRVHVEERERASVEVPLPWDARDERFTAEEVAEVDEFLASVSAIPE